MKKAIPLLWACGIAAITSASTLTSSSDKVDAEVYRAIDVTANEPMELKLHSGAFVWPEEIAPKAAIQTKVKTLTSVADLVGGYVQTSKTLVPTACRDAGNATKISLGTAPDQIVIERFWSNLYTGGEYIKVTANVDVATSVVSIPAQVVFTDANYGAISLVVSGQDGQPMRDASITGTIADDGTIQFTDPWGLYVDSGEHKDKYIYANYATTLRPANATLYFRSYDAPDLMYSYDIYVADNGDNTITVTNMGNAGLEINATLNGNRTISFPYETLMWYPYALNNQNYFFSFSMVSDFAYDPEKKSIQYFQYGLTTFPAEAGDNTTASFGNWALLSTSMGSAYGINSEGMIQLKNGMTFNYPTDYDADFEGSGTEDDPYLIKTVDNLNALALSVNQAKAANNQAIRVYSGVHFKLMADLDLSSIEFTPIGQDSYHCFDGVFDGNGHQIKGMRMNRKNNIVYNGLFGWAGQNSVISNLTVVSPDITSNFYTGIIAAYSSGTVSDCHVVNPVIHNNAQISGGIVGESFGRIINCTVTGAEIYGLGGYAGGIVGEISGHQEVENGPTIKGEISGCSVTDTYINAWTSSDDGSRAGGVAANVYYSDISDCYFSGVVDCIEEYNYSIATFIAGGVAGSVYGGDISRCFAVGNILVGTYKSEVGGVAGTLGGNMTDCYSAGKVYGAKTVYAGGLTGEVKANPQAFVNNFIKSTIKSSYTSAQTVNDLDNINMTGQLPELIGSVKMTGDMTSYTDLVCIESSYFNSDLTYFGNSDCRSTTAALTSVSGPEGFSSGQWLFEANAYPRLKNLADTEAALMSASSILFPEGSSASALRGAATLNPLGATEFLIADGNQLGTEGTYASIKGKVLEIGNQNGLETIVVSNGSVQYPLDISVMGNGLEGLGTEDSPMLIKNKNDLKILSELVTVDNPFHGVYVKMVNDIDMEQDPDFIGIAVSRVNNTSLRFDGIFDGDGHTIHNMWLNGVVWQDGKTPAEDPEGLGTPNTASGQGIMYQAFIGRLNTNGVLRNLNFAADCADERGSNNCAMAVAENYGTIENVRNYADLKSYGANVGAIVSSNQSSGKIINCFNAGNIYSGKNFAGGIAATSAGLIENCANTGNISTLVLSRAQTLNSPTATTFNNVGGIVASLSGELVNVLNTGHASALTNNVGGIAGQWSSKVAASGLVAYGTLTTRDVPTLGGIAGAYGTNQTIVEESTGIYYDAQIAASGAVGMSSNAYVSASETSALVAGTPMAGLDSEVWDFAEGMYPVLKAFADEPSVIAARRMVVTMPAGQNVRNLNGISRLSTAEGIAWSLEKADAFKIEDNELIPPTSVAAEVNDTLSANLGGFSKHIAVSAKPACPLAGNGSAADPYLIPSAEKWNEFASWLEMMMLDTQGVYVTVTSDLDFGGKSMSRLSSIEAVPWNGILDGGNHMLSNYENITEESYSAPFRMVGADGVIKNVTFAGKINAKTGGYVSAVAGKLYGTLDNVKVSTDIIATANLNFIAGLAVYAYSGAVITDCEYSGTISSSGTTLAGIVAYNDGGTTVRNCTNKGNVTTTSTGTAANLGGIAGQSKPAVYINCVNSGDITGSNKSQNVGGIVGNLLNVAGQGYEFTDCSNSGKIEGAAKLGGMTGMNASNKVIATGCSNSGEIKAVATAAVSSSGTAGLFGGYGAGWTVSNCTNTGRVSNTKSLNTAGIAGYANPAPSAANPASFVECVNTGDITSGANQAAGILAAVGNNTTIELCRNTGAVTSTGAVAGGIVATLTGVNSVITSCGNSGDITALNSVGGIIGAGTQVTLDLSRCYNIGKVKATSVTVGTAAAKDGYAAGGIAGRSNGVIANCYNLGDVEGATFVGGLVGQPTKGTTATAHGTYVNNSYNAAKVSVNNTDAAALSGHIIGCPSFGSNWAGAYNTSEDCFYLTDKGSAVPSESVGTGVTTAELAGASQSDGVTDVAIGGVWTVNAYCLPVIATNLTDEALLASICVFQSDGNAMVPVTEGSVVTGTFKIGHPQDVTLTTQNPIVISDNHAEFTQKYNGAVEISAERGDELRVIRFEADATTGLTEVTSDDDVVDTKWYSVDGRRVYNPSTGVYVVVRTHADGRVETGKVVL